MAAVDETKLSEVVELAKKSIKGDLPPDVWYSHMIRESALSGVTEAYYTTLVLERIYKHQNPL